MLNKWHIMLVPKYLLVVSVICLNGSSGVGYNSPRGRPLPPTPQRSPHLSPSHFPHHEARAAPFFPREEKTPFHSPHRRSYRDKKLVVGGVRRGRAPFHPDRRVPRKIAASKHRPHSKQTLLLDEKRQGEEHQEEEEEGGLTSFFKDFIGESFLNHLDLAIWRQGLKDKNQLMALHTLLADEGDYGNGFAERRGEVSGPGGGVQEEEKTVLMVDNVISDRTEEIKDSALKKWLKYKSHQAGAGHNETVQELSYKILSQMSRDETSEDEENDEEIFTAVLASMAAFQLRKLRKQLMHGRVKRDEERVCYRDLGCFTDEGAFDYFDYLPDPPEEIGTKYLLYTRSNPETEQLLFPSNSSSLLKSSFSPSKDTKVIIHGFGSSCHKLWVREMRVALLTMVDVNLICVDWENGATVPNYMRAASNTRLVGRQVSQMIKQLVSSTNASLASFHLIGFSLGAHVSGHAGKGLKLKRISGLDPAGPLFENSPSSVRLDRSDAEYVDVIHTNAESLLWGGLGAYQPMGHVDFYPNGGRMQKGCDNLFVGGVTDILWPTEGDGRSLCNHRRGYKYFVESIAPVCKFPSFVCSSFETFLTGDCFPCKSCGNMGYYSDQASGRGQLYLVTRDQEPFCANQYKVVLKHSGGPPLLSAVSTYGRLDVTFIGSGGINETIPLTRIADEELKAGSSTTRILVPHPAITDIRKVQLLYTTYEGWVYSGSRRWAVDKISLMDSYGEQRSFCELGVTLETGVPMILNLKEGDCTPQYRPWRNKGPHADPENQNTSGIRPSDNLNDQTTRIETQPEEEFKFKPENNDKDDVSTNFAVIRPLNEEIFNASHSSVVIHFPSSSPPPPPTENPSQGIISSGPSFSFSAYSNTDSNPNPTLPQINNPPLKDVNNDTTTNIYTADSFRDSTVSSHMREGPAPNLYPESVPHQTFSSHHLDNTPTVTAAETVAELPHAVEYIASSEEPVKVLKAPQLDLAQEAPYQPYGGSVYHQEVSVPLPFDNDGYYEERGPSGHSEEVQPTLMQNPLEFLRPNPHQQSLPTFSSQEGKEKIYNPYPQLPAHEEAADTVRFHHQTASVPVWSDEQIALPVQEKESGVSPSTIGVYTSQKDRQNQEFSYIVHNERGEQGLLVFSNKKPVQDGKPLNAFFGPDSINPHTGFIDENIRIFPYNSLVDGEVPINEMAKALFGKTNDNSVHFLSNSSLNLDPKDDQSSYQSYEANPQWSTTHQRTVQEIPSTTSASLLSTSPFIKPFVSLSRDVHDLGNFDRLRHTRPLILPSNLRPPRRIIPSRRRPHFDHWRSESTEHVVVVEPPSSTEQTVIDSQVTGTTEENEDSSFMSKINPTRLLSNLAERFSSIVGGSDEKEDVEMTEETRNLKVKDPLVEILEKVEKSNLENMEKINNSSDATTSSEKNDENTGKEASNSTQIHSREKGPKVQIIKTATGNRTRTTEAPSIFSWRYYFGDSEEGIEGTLDGEQDTEYGAEHASHDKHEKPSTREHMAVVNPNRRQERKFEADPEDVEKVLSNFEENKSTEIHRHKNRITRPITKVSNSRFNLRLYPRIPPTQVGYRRHPPNHHVFPRQFPPNYPFHQLNPFTALPTRLIAPPPPPPSRIFPQRRRSQRIQSRMDEPGPRRYVKMSEQNLKKTGKSIKFTPISDQILQFNPKVATKKPEESINAEKFDKSSQPLLDMFYPSAVQTAPKSPPEHHPTIQDANDPKSIINAPDITSEFVEKVQLHHTVSIEEPVTSKNNEMIIEAAEKLPILKKPPELTRRSGEVSDDLILESPKMTFLLEHRVVKLPQPIHSSYSVIRKQNPYSSYTYPASSSNPQPPARLPQESSKSKGPRQVLLPKFPHTHSSDRSHVYAVEDSVKPSGRAIIIPLVVQQYRS